MVLQRQLCVGTLFLLGVAVSSVVSQSKVLFPFKLVEEHHAVAGRIDVESYPGQRVVAILESEGEGEGGEEHFLKIEKEINNGKPEPKAQTTKCCDITMTSPSQRPTPTAHRPTAHRHTQPNPTMTSEKDAKFTTSNKDVTTEEADVSTHFSIPHGTGTPGHARMANIIMPKDIDDTPLRTDHTIHIVHKRNVDTNNNPVTTQTSVVTMAFVVMDTKAFAVDHEGYIVVADEEEFGDKELVEFFVLLEDKSTGRSLSNPLPFIIYIDRPVSNSYPAVPAVFAGVLCLIVVFLAFLIPFVTRAKRRMKMGKPVFKLGSHVGSTADLERVGTFSDMSRSESEPNFMGPNGYYNYAHEVEKEKTHFGRDLKDYARSHPPTLQLTKKSKYSSDESVSSGVDVASHGGAEGTSADERYSQRL